MRTDQEIMDVFSNAFRPLTCKSELGNYGNNVRFTVFDSNGAPLKPTGSERTGDYPLAHIRTDQGLDAAIGSARDWLEAKGFKLDPWRLPKK